jgi:hypothetical protein
MLVNPHMVYKTHSTISFCFDYNKFLIFLFFAEGSKNYAADEKPKDISQQASSSSSSSSSLVPEEPISGQETGSDELKKGKAKMMEEENHERL